MGMGVVGSCALLLLLLLALLRCFCGAHGPCAAVEHSAIVFGGFGGVLPSVDRGTETALSVVG